MPWYPPGFYVYVYADPRSGEPFYVGKGQKYRARAHLKAKTPNIILGNKIKQLRAAGLMPEITIVATPTEADAHALEQKLIKQLGRRDLGEGPLLNYTAGGDGSAGRQGFRHSPEVKKRISEKLKGRELAPEHRARISAGGMGRKAPTPEHLAKMREIAQCPAARKRNSEAQKARNNSEHLLKISQLGAAKTRGVPLSEVRKAEISKSQKGKIVSAEARENMSRGQKRRYAKNV